MPRFTAVDIIILNIANIVQNSSFNLSLLLFAILMQNYTKTNQLY